MNVPPGWREWVDRREGEHPPGSTDAERDFLRLYRPPVGPPRWRRVLRGAVFAAVGVLGAIATALLALAVSSMMPSAVHESSTVASPPPAVTATPGAKVPSPDSPLARETPVAESARPPSGDGETGRVKRTEAVTPPRGGSRERPSPRAAPPEPSTPGEPQSEAERTRRTAAWLLRTYDRDAAEQHVRDAIAFYQADDPQAAFWRHVLDDITTRKR